MAGTAAALGCAAPTREGKAMGRQATAGESTDKGGDGKARIRPAKAERSRALRRHGLGQHHDDLLRHGRATAKIGIATAEDCVGQLRRWKARRWLAAAEHRNAQQGGGEAQLRGCGAGRRIGPHEHGAVRAAMAALWCAGAQRFLATALSGDDGMARALVGMAEQWQDTSKHGKGSAWHWQARAKHTIGGRRHSYERHCEGEARSCVGCVAKAWQISAAPWLGVAGRRLRTATKRWGKAEHGGAALGRCMDKRHTA